MSQLESPSLIAAPPVRRGLTVDHPPHWRVRETADRVFWTIIYAAIPALLAGMVYFGWRAVWVVGLSIGSVLAAEWLFVSLARRPSLARHGGRAHTILMGLLLGLTLPATVSWYVVVVAGVVTIVVGKGLFGGLGHYLWHPALIGRFVVQVIFSGQLAPDRWPVLDRGHLFFGQLAKSAEPLGYGSWLSMRAEAGAHALALPDPLAAVGQMVHGPSPWVTEAIHHVTESGAGSQLGTPAGAVLFEAIWSRLPPLGEMVIGAVGGGIGATCAAAVLLGGLVMIRHGYVRWQAVAAFLLAAALAAAVLPLHIGGPDWQAPSWRWLPGFQFYDRQPCGPVYVAYHLLSAELLLGMFFFASDMVSRPITTRGQVLFGAGCGLAAIVIRLYLFIPGAVFVAILLMNTLTPWIDRITQPRVFGR